MTLPTDCGVIFSISYQGKNKVFRGIDNPRICPSIRSLDFPDFRGRVFMNNSEIVELEHDVMSMACNQALSCCPTLVRYTRAVCWAIRSQSWSTILENDRRAARFQKGFVQSSSPAPSSSCINCCNGGVETSYASTDSRSVC